MALAVAAVVVADSAAATFSGIVRLNSTMVLVVVAAEKQQSYCPVNSLLLLDCYWTMNLGFG